MVFSKNLVTACICLLIISCGVGGSDTVEDNTLPTPEVVVPSKKDTVVKIEDGYINYNLIQKDDITPDFNKVFPQYVTNADPLHTRYEHILKNEEWYIATRHMGIDIDRYNLVEPSNIIEQTGNSNPSILITGNSKGSFTRQYKNSFESVIDTTSFPYYKIRGAGPHNNISAEIKTPAIGAGMIGSFKMPMIDTNGGVSQLSFILYFNNKINLEQPDIAFVNLISDNRESMNDLIPYVGHDTYTSFVSQKIDSNRYATTITPSSYTNKAFKEERDYGFVITEENMTNILTDLKLALETSKKNGEEVYDVDMNPQNYEIKLMAYFQEVFTLENPEIYMKSGFSVKNMQLFHSNLLHK